MKIDQFINLADEHRGRVAETLDPRLLPAMRELFIAVERVLRESGIELTSPRDVFTCCGHLDELRVPEELAAVFANSRTALGGQLLESVYEEKKEGLQLGEIEQSQELVRERDLSRLVAELLVIVKEKKPEGFGPTWIQLNGNGLYERLIRLVRDPHTGISRWDLVKRMLPDPWQVKFTVEKTPTADQRLVEQIKEYEEIARTLGPEALAEFLISLNPKNAPSFSTLVRIISQYLGRCQTRPPKLDTIPEIPAAALLLQGFRKVVLVQLRNQIYRELLRGQDDASEASQYRVRLADVERAARKHLDLSKPVHKELFEELMAYFKEVLNIANPPNMVTHIRNEKTGRVGPFPSLRQRIAMKEMEKDPQRNKNGRLLVSFFMGMGKTGAAFLAKEHVAAKKLLYICPNPDLVKQTADRVDKYYKPGMAPSVGTILSENKDEVHEALKCDVVIMPFSMFSSKVGDDRLVDLVKAQNFDFVVVDEVHNARQEEQRNTETVFEFVTQIPGLYEEGHIMLLSGDPIPNSPDDIVPQLRIYDRDVYSEVQGLRALVRRKDPLVVRNALLDFLLLIDEPEDWKRYLDYVEFDLTEDEARVYTAILEDEQLTETQKLERLSLALLNPHLFSETVSESSVANTVTDIIAEDLKKYDVVMVGENSYKEGVLRPHPDHPGVPSLAEVIERKLREEKGIPNLEVHIYDGDAVPAVRDYIIARSKEKGRKIVIFAMTSTSGIREGVNLSHIHRAIVLEPNYNNPDLAQFVKRFAREEEEDVRVRILQPHDTISEGIRRHAGRKEVLCERLKHSGTLTDRDLGFLATDKLDDSIQVEGGLVMFGTDITDQLLTDRKKLARIFSYLHGRGGTEYQEFIQLLGEKFAELYARYWERTFSGNNARCVAGIMEQLMERGLIAGRRIADVACGPLVMANTLGIKGTAAIESFDLNPYMIDQGIRLFESRNEKAARPITRVTKMDELGVMSESYDCVNMASALHYTKLNVQRKDPTKDERARALLEQNRVLKQGGIFILTMPTTLCTDDEFKNLCRELTNFGLEVLREYTGKAVSTDAKDDPFENFTIVCKKVGEPNASAINLNNLKLTRVTRTGGGSDKPRRKQTGEMKGVIHNAFQINDQAVEFTASKDEEMKLSDEEHERLIETCRTMITDIYIANGRTLENLKPAQKKKLREEGVQLLKNRTKGSPTLYWTFTHESRPEEAYPVFPT